jgi:hypothetical protein
MVIVPMRQIQQAGHQADRQEIAARRTDAATLAVRVLAEQIVHRNHLPGLGLTDKAPGQIGRDLVPRHLSRQNDQRVLVVNPLAQAGPEEIRSHASLNPWVLNMI